MHAEYYTLTGNHIKEEIVYFQKMRLGIGKWVSRRPLIMKEVNWWAYNLLFQKDRLFWKLVLRQPSSPQMEIFHLILRYWYNRLKECIFSLLANVRLLMELCHKLIYFDLNDCGSVSLPRENVTETRDILVCFFFYLNNTRVSRKRI